MNEEIRNNDAVIRGTVSEKPSFSHDSRGMAFYRLSMDVARLSGAVDRLHVIARESLLDALPVEDGQKLYVAGELRSFNNRSGDGPRLIISLYARELRFEDGPDENMIQLTGTLCKAPNYRVTPMGREICDLMVAVNRRYGRSDYLPCIAWGLAAREAAGWSVGTGVHIAGRMQSRVYSKLIDGVPIEKTAYEVSVIRLSAAEPEDAKTIS